MGARPGTIGIIRPGTISAGLFSTHVLPLSVVMEYIEKDTRTRVTLLGIQPDLAQPESGLSREDHEFLGRNLDRLIKILRACRISGKDQAKTAAADNPEKESF
jgi:Ni,Fe-hydrogenase maturation factor